MGYTVKVVVKEDISEKEKSDRLNRFQKAFVTAAVDYYANKIQHQKITKIKGEEVDTT